MLRRLFIPAAVAFLLYSAYASGSGLGALLTALKPVPLLLACLCWSAVQWIGPFATRGLARAVGLRFEYPQLALIHVLRLPAKYLPGGVWHSVSRFAAYRGLEIRQSDAATILVGEHLLALAVSTLAGSALLAIAAGAAPIPHLEILTVAAGCAALALLLLTFGRTRGMNPLVLGSIACATAATTLFWVGAAASFCLYWHAAMGLQTAEIARVAASYLLSWAAGFVAIIAPQGLGVFEWSAGKLLPANYPAPLLVTVVVGFRLVTIAGDLAAWLLALAIAKVRKS